MYKETFIAAAACTAALSRFRLTFIGVACSLAALTILGAVPSAVSAAKKPKPYVLKHPGRESCKAKYKRQVKRVNVRKAGKTVRGRRVYCIPRKRATATPQPAPVPPAAQADTTTILTAKSQVCKNTAFGSRCPWTLGVSVSSAGVPLSSPVPVPSVVFTNPGAPGQTWTVPAGGEVAIYVQTEQFMGLSATTLIQATIGPFGEVQTKTIANTMGLETWSAGAVYGGSPSYLGSESSPQLLPFGASSSPPS